MVDHSGCIQPLLWHKQTSALYRGLVFGKPFLLYHRSGHVPQPCLWAFRCVCVCVCVFPQTQSAHVDSKEIECRKHAEVGMCQNRVSPQNGWLCFWLSFSPTLTIVHSKHTAHWNGFPNNQAEGSVVKSEAPGTAQRNPGQYAPRGIRPDRSTTPIPKIQSGGFLVGFHGPGNAGSLSAGKGLGNTSLTS